jgi:hypothetical protein
MKKQRIDLPRDLLKPASPAAPPLSLRPSL